MMNNNEIAIAIAAPFSKEEVKQRPGRGGKQFAYIDARAVARRITEVLGITGWSFETSIVDQARSVVHGRLIIKIGGETITREDYGYPNSDNDDEPLKSAASDALKRAAVQLGVGAHLYGGPAMRPSWTPAERATIAEQFAIVMESIAAMNAEKADEIISAMNRKGVSSILDFDRSTAEKALKRAVQIMDDLAHAPDPEA